MRNDVPEGESVGEFPPPGVERAGGARGQGLIEHLRKRIHVLEQVPVSLALPPAPDAGLPRPACSFSSARPPTRQAEEAEQPPLSRLELRGLHEIKPAACRDEPGALAFTLACLGHRLARQDGASSPLLWCSTERAAREWGAPYGPGLRAFGLDPAVFVIVQARNALDAAWALEEGLKSRAFIAVLGQIEVTAPLIARRLGLAAQTSCTPCLLLSGHQAGTLPGTLTRWRVAGAASRDALFDSSAPGEPSWHLTLERCRGIASERSWIVEFRHGAYGVRLASRLADRAGEAGEQGQALFG